MKQKNRLSQEMNSTTANTASNNKKAKSVGASTTSSLSGVACSSIEKQKCRKVWKIYKKEDVDKIVMVMSTRAKWKPGII